MSSDAGLPTSELLAQNETLWLKVLDQLPPADQLVAIMKAFAITEGGTLLVGAGDAELSAVTAEPVLETIDSAVRNAFGQQVSAVSRHSGRPMEVIRNAERMNDGWVVRAEVPHLFRTSLFPQLTATQTRLVTLIPELARTEEFGGGYFAFLTSNDGWTLRLSRHAPWSTRIGGFGETDLRTLYDEHYITLMERSGSLYELAPKRKAQEEYERMLALDLGLPGPQARRMGFD